MNGFVAPEDADEAQYRKLVAYPYQRTWLKKFGNAGTHICAMRSKFASEFVTPLLLGRPGPEDGAGAEQTPEKKQDGSPERGLNAGGVRASS